MREIKLEKETMEKLLEILSKVAETIKEECNCPGCKGLINLDAFIDDYIKNNVDEVKRINGLVDEVNPTFNIKDIDGEIKRLDLNLKKLIARKTICIVTRKYFQSKANKD